MGGDSDPGTGFLTLSGRQAMAMLIALNALVVLWFFIYATLAELSGLSSTVEESGEIRTKRSKALQLSCLIVPMLWALVAYATIYATSEHEAVVAAAALYVTCILDLRCWSLVTNINMALMQVGQSAGILITAFAIQGVAGKFQKDLRVKAAFYTIPVVLEELLMIGFATGQAVKILAWQSKCLPRRALDLSAQFANLFVKLSDEGRADAGKVLQAFITRNAIDIYEMSGSVLSLMMVIVLFSFAYMLPVMSISTHELTGIERVAMGMNIAGLIMAVVLALSLLGKYVSYGGGESDPHLSKNSSCFDNAVLIRNVSLAAYTTLVDSGPLTEAEYIMGIDVAKALDIYNRCMNLTYQLTRVDMTRVAAGETITTSFAHWENIVSDVRIEDMGEADCILIAALIIITHIAAEQCKAWI